MSENKDNQISQPIQPQPHPKPTSFLTDTTTTPTRPNPNPTILVPNKEKELIYLWLSGEKNEEDLAKMYGITKRRVNQILASSDNQRTEIEKRILQNRITRETNRIMDLKDDAITFSKSAIREALNNPSKIDYIAPISSLLERVDKISRLNRGEATERSEGTTINKNIDINKLMSELKTDEQKRAFLLEQLETKKE